MDLDGTWVNQNGSTLRLAVASDGTITGEFRTRKGRAAAGRSYDVVGRRNDGLVAFHVDWQDLEVNLHAMVSFTGRLLADEEGHDAIHTVWVLAREFEDQAQTHPTEAWNAFLTNADIWRRV